MRDVVHFRNMGCTILLPSESRAIINDLDLILHGFMLQIIYTTIFRVKPGETKRNRAKRNETETGETKRNETKWKSKRNETKRNEMEIQTKRNGNRNETKQNQQTKPKRQKDNVSKHI